MFAGQLALTTAAYLRERPTSTSASSRRAFSSIIARSLPNESRLISGAPDGHRWGAPEIRFALELSAGGGRIRTSGSRSAR